MRLWRVVLFGVGAILSGCGTNFDPENLTDMFNLNKKEKLPGERRPLFPEGVPGVTQGVPPHLMKGQQQQEAEDCGRAGRRAGEAEGRSQAKAAHGEPAGARDRFAEQQQQQPSQQQQQQQPQAQQQQQQSGANAPWPSPTAQQPPPSSSPSSSPWPSAPSSNTFQR